MTQSHGTMHDMPMPKKSKKPAKVMDHMRVMPAANGGSSVEHHFTSYEHQPEMHVFGAGDGKQFAAHMMEHSGMKALDEAQETGTDKPTEEADEA